MESLRTVAVVLCCCLEASNFSFIDCLFENRLKALFFPQFKNHCILTSTNLRSLTNLKEEEQQ